MFELRALPTPSYIYDLAAVREAHQQLRGYLPEPSLLYYSVKANPHPTVLGCLREVGCHAEVSSAGELDAVLAAGFPPSQVLCTGPAKRDDDVRGAVAAGVREFSVDSPRGLDQLDAIAAGLGARPEVLLRVNATDPVPGVGLAMTGVASQFGADSAWIEQDPHAFTGRAHAALTGLHLYLASNIESEDHLVRQFTTAITTAARLPDRLGVPLRKLDLGGGFGAPYAKTGALPRFPGLADRLAALLDRHFPLWRGGTPVVAFESGRYLTATCGTLRTRVLDVKWSRGKRVVVFESGINHLGGMAGLRRVPPIAPALAGRDGPASAAIGVGPLCTPLDTWTRSGPVPEFAPGEVAEVPNVGAYGLSASLALFLGHPLPDEVVVDGDRVVSMSRLRVLREHSPILEDVR
jgi:diaminopimelate decarboxylase